MTYSKLKKELKNRKKEFEEYNDYLTGIEIDRENLLTSALILTSKFSDEIFVKCEIIKCEFQNKSIC